jgi:hypothetical protein
MLDDPSEAEIAKFQCIVNDDYEDVVAYNDIVDYIEQDDSWDGVWKFKEILDISVQPSDPDYMGSMYNTQLLWESGEVVGNLYTRDKTGVYNTDQLPLPSTLKKTWFTRHSWLETPGLKKRAKTQKRLIRCNQAKLHSFRTKPYTCTATKFLGTTNKLLVSMKQQEHQVAEENSVRLMNRDLQ